MPRAIWSGTISFGLVNVPVKLHTATEEKDVSFHQFSEKGDRIKNKRVSEKTGREIDFKDIVKGYEVSKGKFVIVTPEELESVDPGPKRTIEIEDFVELSEIDPIYYVKTYYLAPDSGQGATRAYALLREAMSKSEKIAIGRFVMRTKQYLVALRPVDKVLTLTTLYFSDEVRDWKDLDVPGAIKLKPREMEIAERLIDSLTTTWKPEKYDDTYRERVLKLVKDKAKGKEIVVEEREEPAKVTDLLAALEASVKEARGARAASSAKKAPARSSATRKASGHSSSRRKAS
jgi:DNA end-binding protein Ku